MSDPGPGLNRFDIASGELRGTHLTLHSGCLVHRGQARLETLPLDALSSVRVEFRRDAGRLTWGAALVIVALLVFLIAAPLADLAAGAAQQMAAGTGSVAAALESVFNALAGLARLLPFAAALAAAGGALLCALGWMGDTTLTVSFSGGERAFAVRGRNSLLLEFSERLCEQILSREA